MCIWEPHIHERGRDPHTRASETERENEGYWHSDLDEGQHPGALEGRKVICKSVRTDVQ